MGNVTLELLRSELDAIPPYPWSAVAAWIAKATPLLRSRYAEHFPSFQELAATPDWIMLPRVVSGGGRWDNRPRRDNFAEAATAEGTANARRAEDAKKKLLAYLEGLAALDVGQVADPSPSETVIRLVDHFQAAVDHLRKRRTGRTALTMSDEYDVQYLLGAGLRLHFDDVRDEEWTPSYANGAARMDFLLKAERIVIETKMARPGLDSSTIRQELAVDILQYRVHPDCGSLVCFVYDPDRRIANRRALEHDLSETINGMHVVTLVRPR